MIGTLAGVLCWVVGLAVATVGAGMLFGGWGLVAAAGPWVASAVVLIQTEALYSSR